MYEYNIVFNNNIYYIQYITYIIENEFAIIFTPINRIMVNLFLKFNIFFSVIKLMCMAIFNNLIESTKYTTNYFEFFYENYACVNDTFETNLNIICIIKK